MMRGGWKRFSDSSSTWSGAIGVVPRDAVAASPVSLGRGILDGQRYPKERCMASRITSSITIARPIEDVFAVLTNVENTEKWFPAKVRESWTSKPPHGVGSTRHAVVTIGWFRTENDAVATVYDPPHRAVMRGTSSQAPFEATMTFEPVAGGTRLEATTELFLQGPAKLLAGPFGRWYGRNWDRGLETLKAMMESGEL
jgi:uncharacterized protein YndB with AHSA1/START domain